MMARASDQIRILHVDDDPGVLDLASRFLSKTDDRFEITTARGTDAGLDVLADEPVDCVVSDYDMPGRTGLEFLKCVREDNPNLPFILFTGKGSEEVASDAISAGATDYLQKDTGREQYELLANRIRNAVVRAQSQQALQYLQELAEHTEHILYSFRADWEQLLFANAAYEDIWGRSIDTLYDTPTDFLDGVHPEDRPAIEAAMRELADGTAVELECRVNATEDYQRWVRVRGHPVHDSTGGVVRVAGYATDITDRKALQQELETRTQRLQEAQRVAGVGSWEWNAATDTVTWSEETYRIFGWDPDAVTSPTFEDWLEGVHPEDRDDADQMVREAMATGTFSTFQHRVERPNGTVRHVECRGDVTMEDGDLVRITGTILDITDRDDALHDR